MTLYKLFIFRGGSDVPQVVAISCSDDDTANKVAAGIAREAEMVEVWHGSRLAGVSCRLRADDAAGLPSRPVPPTHAGPPSHGA